MAAIFSRADALRQILLDFVVSEREVKSSRRRWACCEGLTRSYILWMVYVLRVVVALILASVFLYQPAVTKLLPRSLYFLVLLAACLSVRPFLGMGIVSVYALPLQIGTQWFATGVSFVMPNDPAFSAFIIVLGVLAGHWADLGPGAGKIMSAIWLITLVTKQLSPGTDQVAQAVGLSVGLCLAQCAVLCAQLLPPLTVKRVVDEGLATAGVSMAEMTRLIAKEFARSHTHKRFGAATRRAHLAARSTLSLPSKIQSQPNFLRSFAVASSGHGFHTADRLERADALQEAAQQGLDRLALLPFLQAERPWGSLASYGAVGGVLRGCLARIREMREALPDLEVHVETRIAAFRVDLAPALTEMAAEAGALLSALGRAAGDKAALIQVPVLQERLRQQMEQTRQTAEEKRRLHFGSALRELFGSSGGVSEPLPTRSMLATHVVMQCMWGICVQLLTAAPGPRFVPVSREPALAAVRGWLTMWSAKSAVSADYLRSRAFVMRLANALIVALAVGVSLCFVYIPTLQAIFTQGTWVSLTALFVFTQSSGATLRAARDRLLGIFVGTSYAFIALLILRYTADPGNATPPVAITVFIVVFVLIVFALMQESVGLAMASSYAVILMMNALPSNQAGQSSLS